MLCSQNPAFLKDGSSNYAQFQLNDHQQYEVTFPDFGYEVATYGNNMAEALQAAHESLTVLLLDKEDYGESTPKSSTVDEIAQVNNGLLIPIEVDTTIEREREEDN
ncbi:hypothetical protein LPAF129_06740 [Ligilactobacillus pabuli]|uniref:HicB-like antitoxin of toxin-antitoxin system domain-containing protein n=1 Tax=Ligilactobacillus pabuli TaxID=2886039 RepID=A0ABQ5JG95_9LACO|nr:type II toxin-antitoxin system HicB family antitoxin [Ligilactobacillus pabuli]GKS80989.1 hypothetical protein LPAF129_06740 [Ligilactobacillus pabuli]